MLRAVVFLLIPVLWLGACKSTSSEVKTFEVNGDAAAANKLIVDTVVKAYPNVASKRDVISTFATAIQNAKQGGPTSPENLLKAYYAKIKSSQETETEFDRYVVQQFLVQTNYLATQLNATTPLQFIGNGLN